VIGIGRIARIPEVDLRVDDQDGSPLLCSSRPGTGCGSPGALCANLARRPPCGSRMELGAPIVKRPKVRAHGAPGTGARGGAVAWREPFDRGYPTRAGRGGV